MIEKIKHIFILFFGLVLYTPVLHSQCQIETSFSYTGGIQTFVVPIGADSITVMAWGGGGAGGGTDNYNGAAGGGGGYITSKIPVTSGQTLTVIVGGGALQGTACASNAAGGLGGFGDGAYAGGVGGTAGDQGCSGGGGGGGGASAVIDGTTPLIVAGGGGGGSGGGRDSDGAIGGGGGEDGNDVVGSCSSPGISGGAPNSVGGAGGDRGNGNDGAGGGGGGGGYLGGLGGGAPEACDCGGCGGGGGSSWSIGTNTTIANGIGQIAGNDFDLPGGLASGGNGSSDGSEGYVTIIAEAYPIATIDASTTVCVGDPNPTVIFTGTNNIAPYTFTYTLNGGPNETISTTGTNNTVSITIPTTTVETYSYSLVSIKGADPVVVPCTDVTTATVEAWGAGGAGYGDDGGGGGAGAYASSDITIIPGNTYTLVVGAGAIGISGGAGGNGGSSFFDGNLVVAAGGSGAVNGNGGAGGATGASTGTTINPGGAGGSFDGGGGIAGTGNSSGGGGGGGGGFFGNPGGPGGAGAGSGATGGVGGTDAPANSGSSPGAGGGGAGGNNTGGSGGSGQISITTNNGVVKTATYRNPGTYTWVAPVCGPPPVACENPQTGNVIVVVGSSEIELTSSVGTDDQTLCNNTAITAITYTVSESATNSTATGLPNGIDLTFSSPTITITGVPTVVGVFDYTINTVGSCAPPTVFGRITVEPNTSIVLSSAVGTDAQSVCVNSSLTNITYTVGNGGTSASTVGLPTGVTDSYDTGELTITGIPSVIGNYDYTVTTVGGCAPVSLVGNITVNDLPTASTNNDFNVCQNDATAEVIFTGVGGTPPFSFTYNIDGQANQTVSSLAGQYTVSVIVPTNTITSYTYNLVSVSESGINTCSQLQNGSTVVTIIAPSQGTIASNGNRVCQNDTPPDLIFTGSLGTPPYTFTYTESVITDGVPTGAVTHTVASIGSTATIPSSSAVADTIRYTITDVQDVGGVSCGSVSGFVDIIVDPLPMSTITAAADVCLNGPPTDILFTGSGVTAPVIFDYFRQIMGVDPDPVAQASIQSVAPALTATLTVPSTTLGTTLYTNGITSSNVCQGNIGSGTATITVNPIPTATIIGNTTICENTNTSVTFTGAVGSPPFTFTYDIDGGIAKNITSGSGQFDVYLLVDTIPGTYIVNLLSVSDSFNCNQAATGNATLLIEPLPQAGAGGSGSICTDATHTISGASSAYGNILWTITNGGGSIGNATTLTPTYTPVVNDAVISPVQLLLTVTSNNACNPEVATAAYSVIINPLPRATITSNATVCQNDASPLIVLSGTNGAAPYTFTYSLDGTVQAAVSGSNSFTISAPTSPEGTFVYSLLNVQDASTTSCGQAQTGDATIVVKPLPSATLQGTTTVCQNESTSPFVTYSGSDGVEPYTFTYSLNGVNTTTTTTAGRTIVDSISTASAVVYNYSLIGVSDGNNCYRAINGQDAVIQVNSLPDAAPSLGLVVCQDRPEPQVSFVGSNTPATTYNYTYSVNGIPQPPIASNNGSNLVLSAPTDNTGSYEYVLRNISYENGIICNQVQDDTVIIEVLPLPSADISGEYTVCVGDDQPIITLSASSDNPEAAPYTFKYQIYDQNNLDTITTTSDIIYVPTEPSGVYEYSLVNVIDSKGCEKGIDIDNNSIVTIYEYPSPNFSVTPDRTSILEPTVEIDEYSTGVYKETKWEWDFDDGKLAYEQSPEEYTYRDTGTYVITLTAINEDCINSTSQTVIIEELMLLYIPNAFTPNGEGINEEFKASGSGLYSFEMKVYDRWGNMIFFTDDINKGWDGRANGGRDMAQIDVYVYVIEAVDNKKRQSHTYRGTVNLIR